MVRAEGIRKAGCGPQRWWEDRSGVRDEPAQAGGECSRSNEGTWGYKDTSGERAEEEEMRAEARVSHCTRPLKHFQIAS